jgi:hypothetical protein
MFWSGGTPSVKFWDLNVSNDYYWGVLNNCPTYYIYIYINYPISINNLLFQIIIYLIL